MGGFEEVEKSIPTLVKEAFLRESHDPVQLAFLKEVFGKIRLKEGCTNSLDTTKLAKDGCFFVFTHNYLMELIGLEACEKYQTSFIIDGVRYCKFFHRVVCPIYDVKGNIVALNGYSDKSTPTSPKYLLSKKTVWDRNKYLFASRWDYEEGLRRGYFNVTDGTFDQKRLTYLGEPTGAPFGSSLSEFQLAILRMFKVIIYHADNDDAGMSFGDIMKKDFHLPVVTIYRQRGKDVDDYLSKSVKQETLLLEAIQRAKRSRMNMYVTDERVDTRRWGF